MFSLIRDLKTSRFVVCSLDTNISRWLRQGLMAIVNTFLVLLFSGCAIALLVPQGIAQSPPGTQSGIPIIVDGQTVFVVQDKFLSESIEKRAANMNQALINLANNNSIELDTLQATDLENVTIIHSEDIAVVTISEKDGKLAGKERHTLATEYLQSIQRVLGQYRQQRSFADRIRSIVMLILGTIALIMTWLILNNLGPRIYPWLDLQRKKYIPNLHIQNLELISSEQLSYLLLSLIRIARALLSLTLLFIYLGFVLSLFPETRVFSQKMSSYLSNAINKTFTALLDYLPNLVAIALVIAIAYVCLKFLKLIFSAISKKVFSIPGFYPEWADPTYQLCVYLVFFLSAAIIFPYLPGSSSPGFQGVSIFLGALVSLGSTAAVSNIVAGFVLVYTRAFESNDLIKIGDIMGIVEEKLLLVTRIRTLDNELVTLPNSLLLNTNITNYRALLRDNQVPLILHTTVTLGYDIPWRKVHEAFIAAALATPDIISDPAPFVLQTALNDFYISYQLKAFTQNPENILEIYSALHQNIQDKCNEVGIEICSPHYAAIRDGNHNTIPANYLPEDYKAPGFRYDRAP
ncbi:MAG: mechanosensitive ion channel family protein [Microcoleaceae cyanobacterium]